MRRSVVYIHFVLLDFLVYFSCLDIIETDRSIFPLNFLLTTRDLDKMFPTLELIPGVCAQENALEYQPSLNVYIHMCFFLAHQHWKRS